MFLVQSCKSLERTLHKNYLSQILCIVKDVKDVTFGYTLLYTNKHRDQGVMFKLTWLNFVFFKVFSKTCSIQYFATKYLSFVVNEKCAFVFSKH